jgi:RimJ/RimL family protein N-acetyltransferase
VWDDLAVRLEGRAVVLEPLRPDHEDGLWEVAQDPEVWGRMLARGDESREAFHAWMDEALGPGYAPFAQLDAATGRPLGSTRYMALRPEHRSLEIGGTWLARPAWGTGVNVEAKYLLLRRAFEVLGCLRVEFKTEAANDRSRAALAALPARFEGIHRKHMLVRGGERRDSAWYSVIDDEWPDVRAALERRLDAKLGR